jgi:hypothetical protein
MNDAFRDRMREATILIGEDEADRVRTAVQQFAGVRLATTETLSLVRLAFSLGLGDVEREGLIERFNNSGAEVASDEGQMLATLATVTLIERFSRPIGRRGAQTLRPDMVAASAVVVLADQGRQAVHQDLISHAWVWTAMLAEHLRRGPMISDPPETPKGSAAPDGETEPPPPTAADITALLQHVGELNTWLRQSSSSVRLLALEEQQALLWWLTSGEHYASATTAVLNACEELIDICAFPLGPPGAEQQLLRRLASYVSAEISFVELSQIAARSVPAQVHDICSLLSGERLPSMSVRAPQLATRLYHELQLTHLATSVEGS